MIVLWESTHLCWALSCVVAHNASKDNCVCPTVWNVVESAQLVSHGVVDTQECVSKCKAAQAGSVCHVVACLDIVWIVISTWQVLKDQLHTTKSHTVCVVRCHHGDKCLEAVSKDVDTRSRGQTLRLAHHVVGINNCHVRQQLVVCKWVLNAVVSISDDGKWSYLGTGTRRGWDCNKECLVAHLRIVVDTLADIQEVRCHVLKLLLWVLVHGPHNLTCVHSRTTADCDDAVRLEGANASYALKSTLKGWIWSNIPE